MDTMKLHHKLSFGIRYSQDGSCCEPLLQFQERVLCLWSPHKLNMGRVKGMERRGNGTEITYETSVKVSKPQELLNLLSGAWHWPISHVADLCWVHLHFVRGNHKA